jgi:hypothetical protein
VKLSGLTVSRDCADRVKHYARERGLTVNAALTDVIEEWALERGERVAEVPP